MIPVFSPFMCVCVCVCVCDGPPQAGHLHTLAQLHSTLKYTYVRAYFGGRPDPLGEYKRDQLERGVELLFAATDPATGLDCMDFGTIRCAAPPRVSCGACVRARVSCVRLYAVCVLSACTCVCVLSACTCELSVCVWEVGVPFVSLVRFPWGCA